MNATLKDLDKPIKKTYNVHPEMEDVKDGKGYLSLEHLHSKKTLNTTKDLVFNEKTLANLGKSTWRQVW